MESLGRVPTEPDPHSFVRDCLNCRRRLLLRSDDLDNSFSMSKVAICSRLSAGLEVVSKLPKNFKESVLNVCNLAKEISDLKTYQNK